MAIPLVKSAAGGHFSRPAHRQLPPPKFPPGRAKKVQASKAELLCGCQHGTVTASRLGLAVGLDLNMLFFGSFLSRKSRE